MKIGLAVPIYARWFHGEPAFRVMSKAKELEMQSIWMVDHLILTPSQAVGYGSGQPDVWTATAYFAGLCNAIDYHPYFGQAVAVIPWRPPIQQAQVLATIDHLSGGRLIVGAGAGHLPEAFAALGIPFEERSSRTDEYLRCMMTLWKHPTASFHGRYVNFDNMTIMVRPMQKPHPPILYAGRGPRPFKRVAEYCQGYLPRLGIGIGASRKRRSRYLGKVGEPSIYEGKPLMPWDAEELTGAERLERDLAEIDKYWKQYGRGGKPYIGLSVTVQLTDDPKEATGAAVSRGLLTEGESSFQAHYEVAHVDELVDTLRACEEMGVDHVALRPGAYRYKDRDQLSNLMMQMELLGESVLPKVTQDRGPITGLSYVDSF